MLAVGLLQELDLNEPIIALYRDRPQSDQDAVFPPCVAVTTTGMYVCMYVYALEHFIYLPI